MELLGVGSNTHLLTFCSPLSSSLPLSDTPISFLSFTHSHIQKEKNILPTDINMDSLQTAFEISPQAAYDCTLLTPELDL